jgi:hypothetical protein
MSLTEDQVIDAVVAYLESDGWTIHAAAYGNTPGVDIVAERDGRTLHVEVKGAVTTKATGGKEHTQQHRTNSVVAALGKAVMLYESGIEVALALPRERVFRNVVSAAHDGLVRLGVTIMWVADDGGVEWTTPHAEREASRRRVRESSGTGASATCRHAVLAAARQIHEAGHAAFSPDDIVRAVLEVRSDLAASTIRTHVVSVMCTNALANHRTRFSDLERVGRGRYRLVSASG